MSQKRNGIFFSPFFHKKKKGGGKREEIDTIQPIKTCQNNDQISVLVFYQKHDM